MKDKDDVSVEEDKGDVSVAAGVESSKSEVAACVVEVESTTKPSSVPMPRSRADTIAITYKKEEVRVFPSLFTLSRLPVVLVLS